MVEKQHKGEITFGALALGTWTFAGDDIWSSSEESDCIRVIHSALDQGIKLFDTSPNYGNGRSEVLLGKALQGRLDALVADKLKIDGLGPDEIRLQVERSLTILGREQIDLMQIHWPSMEPGENLAALELFSRMQEEGKIRALGVCNFGVYDLEECRDINLISNQLAYNLAWRPVEEHIVPACRKRDMKIWAYSPLQQGLLTGQYEHLTDFPAGRQRTRHYKDLQNAVQEMLSAFIDFCRRQDLNPTATALRYIWSGSQADTVLAGARNTEQLSQLIEISQESDLPEDIMEELNRLSEPLRLETGGNPDMYQSRVRY
ncbi:MAG: aldo/keto reductase [Spirochaetales bacterium]|nr:aldo/keto reductase [Spirochaetales bacterium]